MLVAAASIAVMMMLVMAPVALALDVPFLGRSPFAPPPASAFGSGARSEPGKLHDARLHETGPRL